EISIAYQSAKGDRSIRRGRVHNDDLLQSRAGADGVELVVLLARGNNCDAAPGICNEFGDLLARKSGVDGHVSGADSEGCEIGNHPFPTILRDKRNAVALLRSPGQKRLGQRTNTLIDLVRRYGLPMAELVLPEHGARIGRGSNAAKKIIDGINGRDHRGIFELVDAQA